jgi:hypothetical protein
MGSAHASISASVITVELTILVTAQPPARVDLTDRGDPCGFDEQQSVPRGTV